MHVIIITCFDFFTTADTMKSLCDCFQKLIYKVDIELFEKFLLRTKLYQNAVCFNAGEFENFGYCLRLEK